MEKLSNPEQRNGSRRPEEISNYQPTYPDLARLAEALDNLRDTTPVTTPQNIDAFRQRLAETYSNGTLVVAGRCSNPVRLDTPISTPANESLTLYSAIKKEYPDSEIALRDGRGQSAKPRSNDTEMISGREVCTYRGDMINGLEPIDRTPDPSRMVATALQARDIEEFLTTETGQHIPHAHEALLLPYEQTFIYTHNGEKYLLSADLPWIGERTRDPDGPHVEMLAQVKNPVGVKIGPEATPADIKELATKLNPGNKFGRLVFMLRLGLKNTHKLAGILEAIKSYAPSTLILCDPVHGNTKNINGIKTRFVEDIINEVQTVSKACSNIGLRLHGIHLEAMSDPNSKQCIDHPDEQPEASDVDPNLNLKQLQKVLRATKEYL